MVRTKADGCSSGRKALGAQAPRKSFSGASSSTGSSDGGSPAGKGKYAGGNPVCPRPTPDWQKGISTFFTKPSGSSPSKSQSSQDSKSSSSSSED
ncbi:PCNA-associated factor-like [Physella acuta]|uniref:PCNA-associated factor-like n=1 Tax=Physella acuta TaxID=109671 RepID=UPI0027DAE79F|nr:PCNA-associated factor-like [Physella acuta]